MREVSVIGIGQTPVGEHWTISLRHLALEAIRAALDDAGLARVDALYVANTYASVLSHQGHLGAFIADFVGMRGVEALTVRGGRSLRRRCHPAGCARGPGRCG